MKLGILSGQSLSVALAFLAVGALCLLESASVPAQTSGSEPPTNLLSNGGFEEGEYYAGAHPPNWIADAWLHTAEFVWDHGQAHTGERSAMIRAMEPNDARWLQAVGVKPNTAYFLSGWIKTDNVAHSLEPVDAGANLTLFGTYTFTDPLFGTNEWARRTLIFNSDDNTQITVGGRLGYSAGTTTGTAWFDDMRVTRLTPMFPHPSWKILVLIYQETDLKYTDEEGVYHHYVASMTQEEVDQATSAARQFAESDIPALTSGHMVPKVTVHSPDRSLDELSRISGGWWPSPEDTAVDRDPQFDSVIVIWDPRATDLTTGEYRWIGFGDGLTPNMGTGQTYLSMQIDAAISRGHRNVFKHEWGHSILFFFDAIGTAPKPAVNNHSDGTEYVNCETGEFYVWQDETLTNPIPNSIYNNESGFTHDYYSGKTATVSEPTRCIGITPEAWAIGGPISHSGNLPPNQMEVELDIKPGNQRNVVNPGSKGHMWVAILSNSEFDALQVDRTAVALGPYGATPNRYRVKDVNRDRAPDLMLRFRTPQVGLQCGDKQVELTGETYAGDSIIGSDAVKTVGCKKPKKGKKK